MILAKLTAVTGLALFLAGAAGVVPSAAVAAGSCLFLVASVIGAVVLEGRDLEPAAGLLYGIDGAEDDSDEESAVLVAPVVERPTAA